MSLSIMATNLYFDVQDDYLNKEPYKLCMCKLTETDISLYLIEDIVEIFTLKSQNNTNIFKQTNNIPNLNIKDCENHC